MARWYNDKMTRWQDGKMARWQDDKMARWRPDEFESHMSSREVMRTQMIVELRADRHALRLSKWGDIHSRPGKHFARLVLTA
jgi:hypothetical protein